MVVRLSIQRVQSLFFLMVMVCSGVGSLSAMDDDAVTKESFTQVANRSALRMQYAQLTGMLYEMLDEQHSVEAWQWISEAASHGIVPCYYFWVRNLIKKFQNTMFQHEVNPQTLLGNILVLLMLVEIDIRCWIGWKVGNSKKEADKICSVYVLFKNKLKKLLNGWERVLGQCDFGRAVHDAANFVALTYQNNEQYRRFVPCGWVCACADTSWWGRLTHERIMYGEPVLAVVAAEQDVAHDIIQRRKGLVAPIAQYLQQTYRTTVSFWTMEDDFSQHRHLVGSAGILTSNKAFNR